MQRHQFIGNQVIKIFAAKDDEVRIGSICTLLVSPCWWWPVATALSSEQHAGVALSALIRALHELQMVAIVRYAYDRRCNPQIGAAFPCIKQQYEVSSCSSAQTAVFSIMCQMEQSKYVSLINSVWCISSCLSWKTLDSFHSLLLKTTRRSLPQVPCFCLSFSRLSILVPRIVWLTLKGCLPPPDFSRCSVDCCGQSHWLHDVGGGRWWRKAKGHFQAPPHPQPWLPETFPGTGAQYVFKD